MTVNSEVLLERVNSDYVFNLNPLQEDTTQKAWNAILKRAQKANKPEPLVYGFTPLGHELLAVELRSEFLQSKQSEELEKSLERLVSGHKVLSLDVFDTLVLRNNKPEAQRYLELSDHILSTLKKKGIVKSKNPLNAIDICLARVNAMQVNYRIRNRVSGCIEGSIVEIIAIQVSALNLPVSCNELFWEEEIAYEVDNLVPNPAIVRLAKNFKQQHGDVVLVSDMYLDADSIDKILDKVIGDKVHSKLYSSSDLVVSKRSGKIFKKVEKDLNKQSKDFIHIGDSFVGDVSKPRQAGWSALHFPISKREIEERKSNLELFIDRMAEQGIDVTSWAKI